MRITKEPSVRKQEILDAAIRIFSEKGYEKTSISDIAKSINIAQGLCYRYFPSKEDLFESALDEYSDVIVKNMLKNMTNKNMNLSYIISHIVNSAESKNDEYYDIFHGDKNSNLHNRLLLKVCQKLVPIVKNYLADAQERNEIDVPNLDVAASFCVYGQLGILLKDDIDESSKGELIKTFLKYILKI